MNGSTVELLASPKPRLSKKRTMRVHKKDDNKPMQQHYEQSQILKEKTIIKNIQALKGLGKDIDTPRGGQMDQIKEVDSSIELSRAGSKNKMHKDKQPRLSQSMAV